MTVSELANLHRPVVQRRLLVHRRLFLVGYAQRSNSVVLTSEVGHGRLSGHTVNEVFPLTFDKCYIRIHSAMFPQISSAGSTGNKRRVFWICGLVLMSTVVAILVYKGPSFLHMEIMTASMMKSLSTGNNGHYYKYKVICMILTRASNWETRGKAVKNTWAKRCHKAIFFYSMSQDCPSQPICNESSAVGLNIPDGRDHLTAKTLGALNYSYVTYGAEADYFLKADDDTYVIAENLQEMLSRFKSIPFLYLGRKIDNILPKGYNSGGAGYIISNEAAKLLVEKRTLYPKECQPDGGYEDVETGRCLAKFGIYPQDEIDSSGRLTFHSDNPFRVLLGEDVANAYYVNFSGAEFGNKKMVTQRGFMLSQWTATMHYVRPAEIYMFDFLLYHVGSKRNDIEYTSATDDQPDSEGV